MSETFEFSFTQDEAEIILDALESDMEGYADSMNDARANGDRATVQTFSEAVKRIKAVRDRIRAVVGDED